MEALFQSFLFALTLWNSLTSLRVQSDQHSIMYVFVRDGTWAFAMIFGKNTQSYHPILLNLVRLSVMELLNALAYGLIKSPLVGVGYG